MRIKQLDLIAYGHFSGASLDFSEGRQGLHLIYGPNEAGKSSTLRAILHFLYGIPVRDADNFLHPNASLRIGATLEGRAGKLTAIRRKGNIQTLRAADDKTPVEDAVLRQFLPVDSVAEFQQMFGINYERLLHGGEQLLAGNGNFGKMLFAASAGITNLPAIQQEFTQSAQELYTARSQKARIPAVLAEMKKAQERLTKAQTTPAEYKKLSDELEATRQELAAVARLLQEKLRERERLTRLDKALPWLAKREQFRLALEPLRDAVLLPDNFALLHQAALSEYRRQEAAAEDAMTRLARLEEEAQGLPVDDAILAQAAVLKPLYEDLGAQRTNRQDRPKQEGKLAASELEARHLLAELGRADCPLEEIGRLRLNEAQRRRIQSLIASKGELDQKYRDAWERVQDLQRLIRSAEKELAAQPPARSEQALQRALLRTQQLGPLESQAEQLRREMAHENEALEGAARSLPMWRGGIRELEAASVPFAETVQRHELRWNDLAQRRRQFEQRLVEITEADDQVNASLTVLSLEQEVPTEADLQTARDSRDERWAAVRDGQIPLAEAARPYEALVANADKTADRLRREAARVTEKSRLLADRRRLETQRLQIAEDVAALNEHQRLYENGWRELWPREVTPGTPSEMKAWLQSRSALCARFDAQRARSSELEEVQQKIRSCREQLSFELRQQREPEVDRNETLVSLIERAQAVVAAIQKQIADREKAQQSVVWFNQELPASQEKMRAAQAAREGWRDDWDGAVQPLGLTSEVSTEEAQLVLERLMHLAEKAKEIDDSRRRIAGILGREEDFRKRVSALTASLAEDLVSQPAEQAVAALYARLTKAQQNQALLSRNKVDQGQTRQDIDKSRRALREQAAQLEGLRVQAECADLSGLFAAAERSTERRRLESAYHNAEERVVEYSLGDPAALERDAAVTNGDEIRGMLEQLSRDADELREREQTLTRTRIEIEHRFRQLEQDHAPLQAAEEYENHQAALGNHVEEYVRLRLAALVLNESIRRYREKNQGPLLARSSELFRLLTNGSFSGLELSWDDKGESTLEGIRGASGVRVEGMSEGTRDQLYLALRLASLEAYCAEHEPAPFIVDDILINFDDQRAIATLKALAELSSKTQVLLFTHHEHLVELARRELPSNVLFTHGLLQAAPSRGHL